MQRYRDVDGDSGIEAYENGAGFIRIQFHDMRIYVWTNESAGAGNIAQMQALAARGEGLNAFINAHVRKAYARRER